MKEYTAEGHLRPRPPFDFAPALTFLRGFPLTRDEQTLGEQTLTRALAIAGQPIAFQVTSTGSVDAPTLHYSLVSPQPIFAAMQRAVADRLAFFLSLDDDLAPFYARAAEDAAFAPVLQQLYGYHQVKFLT